jgi:chemotaxis protein methyltransferase CheR
MTNSCTLSHSLLSDFSKFVEERMGLHFPKERFRDLERGLFSAAKEFGYKDACSYLAWLLSTPLSHSQIEMLASHLTVGETYFYRDKGSFEALREHVLPGLIQSRRGKEQRLRFWSAGCATGEEAYSIAMLLDNIIPDIKDWSITILATDINPHFLKSAAEGVYREWSFRSAPLWVKERYFTKTKDGFEVLPRIREMVSFAYHNLVDDPYPALINNTSAMDIIFCRNVLMYFSRKRTKEVVRHLNRCLTDNGWLVISPVEHFHAASSLFKVVKFPGATLYKKAKHEDVKTPLAGTVIETPTPKWGDAISQLLHDIAPAKEERAGSPYEELSLCKGPGETALSGENLPLLPQEDNAEASMVLQARSAADRGRLSDALELCEKAIGADKLNPSLHYLYATVLQESGRSAEAAASFKRAIYIDQDFVIAHFALGHLMHRQGRYKEAGRHFENACSILKSYGQDDILPESEGISAGRLIEIIQTMRPAGAMPKVS